MSMECLWSLLAGPACICIDQCKPNIQNQRVFLWFYVGSKKKKVQGDRRQVPNQRLHFDTVDRGYRVTERRSTDVLYMRNPCKAS